eukprot:1029111-Alexandrium_andersonii.AAC.1
MLIGLRHCTFPNIQTHGRLHEGAWPKLREEAASGAAAEHVRLHAGAWPSVRAKATRLHE